MGKLELILETAQVSLYSPKYEGESKSEFSKFLLANQSHEHWQLRIFFEAILSVIEKIGETGALERFFRPEGGNVKAIPLFVSVPSIDRRVGKMRLYCLRLSDKMMILGGGLVTTARKNSEDPAIMAIIDDLRRVELNIREAAKQAGAEYEDFDAIKRIVENITI